MSSNRGFVICKLGNLPSLGHGSRLTVTFPTLIWFPLWGPSPKYTPTKLTVGYFGKPNVDLDPLLYFTNILSFHARTLRAKVTKLFQNVTCKVINGRPIWSMFQVKGENRIYGYICKFWRYTYTYIHIKLQNGSR